MPTKRAFCASSLFSEVYLQGGSPDTLMLSNREVTFHHGNLMNFLGEEPPACLGDAASVGSVKFDNYSGRWLKLLAASARQ